MLPSEEAQKAEDYLDGFVRCPDEKRPHHDIWISAKFPELELVYLPSVCNKFRDFQINYKGKEVQRFEGLKFTWTHIAKVVQNLGVF